MSEEFRLPPILDNDQDRNTAENIARRKARNAANARRAWIYFAVAAVGLAGTITLGVFWWPGPMIAIQQDKSAKAEKIAAEKTELALRISQDQERTAHDAAMLSEIRNASDIDVRDRISACKRRIGSEATGNSSVVASFPAYSVAGLHRLSDISRDMGISIGQLPVELNFDSEDYNFEILRKGNGRRAEFVVVGASEGFGGVAPFIAVYSCEFEGMTSFLIRQDEFFPLD